MGDSPGGTTGSEVDPEVAARVVNAYPVDCALVYGSHVDGTATDDSDVDVAIGFEDGLAASERLDYRIELTTELAKTLGTDDVDVADLDDIRPEVGLSALDTGIVLVGDKETLDRYREQFERDTDEETRNERMQRFDKVLDRLEGQV